MKKILFILIILFFSKNVFALDTQKELSIIKEIALEYHLNHTELILLYAIRQAENGAVGREFGVLDSVAMRYGKGKLYNPLKSFYTQARWCAGTIKKRFNNDLVAFQKRYCPLDDKRDIKKLNKNWLKNVKYFMSKCPL